ncbi:MAG: FHA domain-containing protein [Candidatus Aquicultorales bacterium]
MFNVTVMALKYALLAGLYIFLIIVLRTIYLDARERGAKTSPRLVVLKGEAARGTAYPLSGELLIGREVEGGLSVPDSFVSTRHARVYADGGGFVVEDLGSKNGTFLNGRRLSGGKLLQPGDRIKLGETILQFLE